MAILKQRVSFYKDKLDGGRQIARHRRPGRL
jgi:hypothetical protein